ncbi:MAG: glycoside hydrolase family 2 protein [Acutalibacter muris]|nr:glycoside hydrolase family 2 protein [Acutalibacter muris]
MQKIPFNFGWERTSEEHLFWREPEDLVMVDLPDDCVLELPRGPEAVGGARVGFVPDSFAAYIKRFDLPSEWRGKRVLLNLEGAYMNAQVDFNKHNIAMHHYGYTPLIVDLTPYIRADVQNELTVQVSGNQPSSRWYSGTGIYRGVELWLGEACYVDPRDLFVTTPMAEKDRAQVLVQAEVTNTLPKAKDAVLTVKLEREGKVCAGGTAKVSLKPEGKTACELTVEVDSPALWDDITPNLYKAVVTLETEGQEPDVSTVNVGIRKIEVSAEEGFRINGRKTKLYGGCLHHDNAMIGARAMPKAEERKLRLLKEAGYNAVRTAHNPPSEALLDACDRLGILVIDEFFDCWRTGKNRNDYHLWFEDWWQRDIESTMRRDRNHPSIYCWSFGNEIPEANGYSECERWMKLQADFIRTIDSSRLVTCGGMFMPKCITVGGSQGGPLQKPDLYVSDEEHLRLFESMIHNLDIVSINYQYQNYEKFHELFPDMPLQGTETQGIVSWGNWRAVKNNEHVIGDFIWTCIDNLGEAGAGRCFYDAGEMGGPMGLMAGWPWLSCYQGDLALDGERLPRAYYRNVIWGNDKGIHLFVNHPEHAGQPQYGTGWHWHDVLPCWTYPESYVGKPVDVEAYADCDEVEFFINGTSCAKAKPEEMIARASLTYQPGELKAVAYRDGKAVAEDALATTGPAVQVILTPECTELAADGMDLCYVSVTLADIEGRRVYGGDVELNAAVSGAGTLLGFGSNNPCTTESFGTGRRWTWNGRAMIVLRAGQEPGDMELTVSGGGVPAAAVQVSVV